MRRGGAKQRRDANESAIIDALRALGVTVFQLHGDGVPDLLCYHARTGWMPIEVKSEKGSLTPSQSKAHGRLPIGVVRTVDDALRFFGFFGVKAS